MFQDETRRRAEMCYNICVAYGGLITAGQPNA